MVPSTYLSNAERHRNRVFKGMEDLGPKSSKLEQVNLNKSQFPEMKEKTVKLLLNSEIL